MVSRRLGEAQAAWKLTGSQRPTDAPNIHHSLPRSPAERRQVGALLACPRPCRLACCSACHPHVASVTQLNLGSWLPGCHRRSHAVITRLLVPTAAHCGPPYSTEGLAGPSLSRRRSPIRSTVSLSNRFESPGRGGGASKTAAGKRRDEVRVTNRRRAPASTSPPPLTVANPRAALRQPGGGGLWVRRRKQPTNQVAPTPYPNPHPPRIWFTAWSAGSSAAADWLSKAWSHPSDPKVLEGGGGGGPVQSASRKPPVGTPCC